MAKKNYKIGDQVTVYMLLSSGRKRKVKGKIKAIKTQFGHPTYVVTEGVVEDFSSRSVC